MDALLVVDVQYDFCPGGALGVPDGDAIIPVVNRLVRVAPHVLQTQDWHPVGHTSFASTHGRAPHDRVQLAYGEQILWPDHCVPGTHGAEFHHDLDTRRTEVVVRKGYRLAVDSYSTFFENDRTTPTGLHGYLQERGLRRLAICGLATDFCVLYSTLDARRLGYDITVVVDATRGIDVDGSLLRAWDTMRSVGARLAHASELGA